MAYRRRGFGQITDAQSAANCAAGGGTYDSDTGDCSAPVGGSLYSGLLGTANNCANNTNPGTTGDVNCPFWCSFLPSVLQTAACWPCTNICAAGTNFDTTNNVCSATPATTNCTSGAAGCPAYCTLPFTSSLAACVPCANNNTSPQSLLVVGGFMLVGALVWGLLKR
jgi:hypothetical protein